MSKVKITGNASGTGTLTIAAPNTNTDRTLMLPDGAGEILTDASSITAQAQDGVYAFHAWNNGTQTLSNTTDTVIDFDTEYFDYGNVFNNSTYTFTAPVTGIYQFNFQTRRDGEYSGSDQMHMWINGSDARRLIEEKNLTNSTSYSLHPTASWTHMLQANDTVQLRWYINGTGSLVISYGNFKYASHWSGYLVKDLT